MIRQGLRIFRPLFSTYSKAMYEAWKQDPKTVHQDWQEAFKNYQPTVQKATGKDFTLQKQKDLANSAYMLIRYYKFRGHEAAQLDPLRLVNFAEFGKVFVEHSLENDLRLNKIYNEKDQDIPFYLPHEDVFFHNIADFLKEKSTWTLREIHDRIKKIYSNKVGFQFMHICDINQRNWIMKQAQQIQKTKVSKEDKLKILEDLTKSQTFNYFLNDKLKTSKRFGVEGLDSMISGLNKLVEESTKNDIEYIGMGMAHRGRLSALVNVFHKPLQKIFAEFQENVTKQESWGNSGDVKYHLGTTIERNVNGKKIRLSILPNPSHLETVNPVLMGHVKAVNDEMESKDKSLAVIIHGDAALAGQGIVYECLQMANLNHYSLNGVIHIVANNQIGFTTTPAEARTGLYCTDVAKSIQSPIIHVNADQPELVNQAIKLAVKYRQAFKKDIFVDIIGYRRYGHNEQDQPAFTQPMMYQLISKRPNIHKIYSDKLIQEGVVSESQVKEIWNTHLNRISQAYAQSLNQSFDLSKWRNQTYHRVIDFQSLGQISRTGLSEEKFKHLGQKLTTIPEKFSINPTIKKIFEARKKSIEIGDGIDFGLAESLAFGSLVSDGFNIRLSGQDIERGTFSHRHAVLVDQQSEEKYIPLRSLLQEKDYGRVQIENSLLSEYAALGFQYGYSLTDPSTLTIWQAQFGDFANGAQIVIDNYLTSGQSKWNTQNGLVMNLPHGMDGQGPEHSSARIERYLQLSSDSWTNLIKNGNFNIDPRAMRNNNFHLINCSTAGNLFHAMRRQLRRDYRKPLINIVNKKLLKLKEACTNFATLNQDRFKTTIDQCNPEIKPEAVKRIILLTGQAYYSALQKRTELGRNDVAIIRIEQIAPLHYAKLISVLEKYTNAQEYVWFQEEHRNSGAWSYINPRISLLLEQLKKEGKIKSSQFECISRKNSASTASGKKKKHDEEQSELLKHLFSR